MVYTFNDGVVRSKARRAQGSCCLGKPVCASPVSRSPHFEVIFTPRVNDPRVEACAVVFFSASFHHIDTTDMDGKKLSSAAGPTTLRY